MSTYCGDWLPERPDNPGNRDNRTPSRRTRNKKAQITKRPVSTVISSGQSHLGAGRRAYQALLEGQVLRDPVPPSRCSENPEAQDLLIVPFEGREIRIPADPSELLPLLAESGRCGLSLIGDAEPGMMLAGTDIQNGRAWSLCAE